MRDILGTIISIAIAACFAWAGSQGGPTLFGYPALIFIVAIGFLIHWLIFLPSFLLKTEKFYDITGTVAYLAMIGFAVYTVGSGPDALTLRTQIVATMVIFWALRLGLFLLIRILQVGEDKRFQVAKTSFAKFLMFFSISGLWVFLTTANALTLILNNTDLEGDIYFIIGSLIWIMGISFEVIADEQKRKFRENDSNHGKFITTGLWSISRHPNYFGEILIWIGMAIISFPALNGWQYTTLISPIFVTLLLTRVSGVNHLETYQSYKSKTALLIPFTK